MLRTLAFLLFLASSVTHAHASSLGDGEQFADSDWKLQSCTALIEEGKLDEEKMAVTHANRGYAYRAKLLSVPAIADFDKAIAPGFARAYAPALAGETGIRRYQSPVQVAQNADMCRQLEQLISTCRQRWISMGGGNTGQAKSFKDCMDAYIQAAIAAGCRR